VNLGTFSFQEIVEKNLRIKSTSQKMTQQKISPGALVRTGSRTNIMEAPT
jgi:hypothetical protein